MMEAMLNRVKDESERIGARFLEPACGSGDGLAQVLRRKLASVDRKYGQSEDERRHFALLALMCVYGIEPRPDHIVACRARLLKVIAELLQVTASDELCRAASGVLALNIVHGDALRMCMYPGQPFTFAEWRYLGGGQFQRRDFRFGNLIDASGFDAGSSPFDDAEREIFAPVRTHRPLTVRELATAMPGAAG
jgi:hypothetical protein